jgi:hypothetical protein
MRRHLQPRYVSFWHKADMAIAFNDIRFRCSMIESILSRRHFNCSSLISLLAAMGMPDGTAVVQQQANLNAATRRDVIRQELPGEPGVTMRWGTCCRLSNRFRVAGNQVFERDVPMWSR